MKIKIIVKHMLVIIITVLILFEVTSCNLFITTDEYESYSQSDYSDSIVNNSNGNLLLNNNIRMIRSKASISQDSYLIRPGCEEDYVNAGLQIDRQIVKENREISGKLDSSKNLFFQIQTSFKGFEYVCFWLYLEQASNTETNILLNCQNSSYYRYKINLDWTGWRLFEIPLYSFLPVHDPDLNQMNSIGIYYGGWGTSVDDKTVVYIDSLYLVEDIFDYNLDEDSIDNSVYRVMVERIDDLIDIGTRRNYTHKNSYDEFFNRDEYLSVNSSANLTDGYNEIFEAAKAWAFDCGAYYHDKGLLEFIIESMEYLDNTFYSKRGSIGLEYDNWWDWDIGIPTRIVNIVALLYRELSGDQIKVLLKSCDKYNYLPSLTGANKVSIGYVTVLSSILQHDAKRLVNCREELRTCIDYVSCGDGFYSDGSFIQHGVIPYTGSYGTNLIRDYCAIIDIVSDTVFCFEGEDVNVLANIIVDSFLPFMYKGAISSSVRGRSVDRQTNSDIRHGSLVVESMLLLYPHITEEKYKELMLSSINSSFDYWDSYYVNVLPEYVYKRSKFIQRTPETTIFSRYYFNMDRATMVRPDWAFQISLSSSRIAKYEAINGENGNGWYTGDGMTYLYTTPEDYDNSFWKEVNHSLIPGTTVTNQQRVAEDIISKDTLTECSFVGGCTYENIMVVAMDFSGASESMDFDTSLVGKKSWFIIEDMILCIGTGISCNDNCDVVTVIENRKKDERKVYVDGRIVDDSINSAKSIYIENYGGIVSFNQDIRLSSYENGGVTFFEAIIDHGKKPSNAGYCYALFPMCSYNEIDEQIVPDFEIIRNDNNTTAVRISGKEMYIFWNRGECNGIEVEKPCVLIIDDRNASLVDPTQSNKTVKTRIYGEELLFYTNGSGATVTLQLPADN